MNLISRNRYESGVVDPWTAVHFASGLATGLAEAPLGVAVVSAIAFDVAFGYLTQRKSGLLRGIGEDPAINKVVDIACFALGNYWGRKWSEP